MSNYIIEGGKRVEGKVKISGSKNSSLPIIAATITEIPITANIIYTSPCAIASLMTTTTKYKNIEILIATTKLNTNLIIHNTLFPIVMAVSLFGIYPILILPKRIKPFIQIPIIKTLRNEKEQRIQHADCRSGSMWHIVFGLLQ